MTGVTLHGVVYPERAAPMNDAIRGDVFSFQNLAMEITTNILSFTAGA